MEKLQFVRALSSDAKNVVVGLVRNKAAAEKAFAGAVPQNVKFFEADITDRDALKVWVLSFLGIWWFEADS